jgi:hypothetical protein
MEMFYTYKPFGQSFLGDDTQEYHIYFNKYEDYSFTYTYKIVTSNSFMEDVYKYILDNFEDKLITHGNDTRYDEDGVEEYIWVHVNKDSAKKDITSILHSLEAQYLSYWRFQRIPTLLTIVQKQLDINLVLAYAVSDFQRRRGLVETQNILHVLFNDINT